jgi:hypothetical protein
VAVAFRTAADDMRDPVLALSSDEGEVFAPLLVSEDRWHLQGCPDVGPALTAGGAAGGWYAWYTGADPAGVYMVPWYPGRGPSGVKRPLAEGMLDATHPRLAPAGTTTWIAVEGRPVSDSSRTVLAVRALDPDGRMTPWVDLGAGARSGWIAAPSATSLIGGWVEGERQHPRLRLARVERRR